jgi:predicted transcriptional regulator YheO
VKANEKLGRFRFLAGVVDGIAAAVGPHCEVVLHNFAHPECSIVAIANGHVTGREVGGSLDALALEKLRSATAKDLINYRTVTPDGKILRSSSIHLVDEKGRPYGALCINVDITPLVKFDQFIQEVIVPQDAGVQEHFENNIDDVLEMLIRQAIESRGRRVAELKREDKIAIISRLDARGAFLVRYSVERVAKLLNLSKYTIYNYLDRLKSAEAKKTGQRPRRKPPAPAKPRASRSKRLRPQVP